VSESEQAVEQSLWTIEFPRGRCTRWHQSFAELILQVGQQIGLAMALGYSKGLDWRLEMEHSGGRSLRMTIHGPDEEFVVLDAHVESTQ
jgi:hypothetical protein